MASNLQADFISIPLRTVLYPFKYEEHTLPLRKKVVSSTCEKDVVVVDSLGSIITENRQKNMKLVFQIRIVIVCVDSS